MNERSGHINKDAILARASDLIESVETAFKHRTAAHEAEKHILSGLLEMGFMLMSYLFELYQGGDRGETVALADGREVRRLPEQHPRSYLSIFGEFTLFRWVYGTREGQKIEHIPMDQQLQLPEKKYSYLLQNWAQSFAVDVPFAEAVECIRRILTLTFPVSGLERTVRSTSESANAWFDQQGAVEPAEPGQLIVASADGKGVVIRKPGAGPEDDAREAVQAPEVKPAHAGQAAPKGHFGTKKMAVVGAAYHVDPFPRTPEAVLEALFRPKTEAGTRKDKDKDKAGEPRPRPVNKHVRACMDRDENDTLLPARQTIFAWLDQEIGSRNPGGKHTVVMLMDGEEKLREMSEAMTAAPDMVPVLDIIHVSSYVWKAVEALNPKHGTRDNLPIVKGYMDTILNGQGKRVIRSFRYLATYHVLTGKRLEQVTTSAGYFEKNLDRMRYDEYLARGYPIASGIIEGACRHVIVDRMEGSGMRWIMSGAKAMLNLRCIYINGAWDQFMVFHIQQEQQKIHAVTAENPQAANDDVFSHLKVA